MTIDPKSVQVSNSRSPISLFSLFLTATTLFSTLPHLVSHTPVVGTPYVDVSNLSVSVFEDQEKDRFSVGRES